MCVRGSPHVKNNTDELMLVHFSGHDGWGYFYIPPHSQRGGPDIKFTEETWFPGREFSVPCVITKPDGIIIWRQDVNFKNFEILASAFIETFTDPAGQITIKPATFSEIQDKIAENFFGHTGDRRYPTSLSRDFDFNDSKHLEAPG